MCVITIISILLLIFVVGYALREEFAAVLPVVTAGCAILLYILGHFRRMTMIGVLAVAFLLIMALAFALMSKKGRLGMLRELRAYYLNPKAIIVILVLIFIAVVTCGHIAVWWDDINYWATDAKALFYLNGFTGKYGNVAPEFGDYPPGLQIMKWMLLQFGAGEYHEGLAFSGYYLANMIFLLPLLGVLRKRKAITYIPAMLVLFLIPGVVNDVWRYGTCADITLGILYGAVLISIFDEEGHTELFYYLRLSVFMGLMSIIKNTSIEWMAYSIIAMIMYSLVRQKRVRLYLYPILSGVAVWTSWWIYCLCNRRIAKLTSTGVHMVAGGYSLPDETASKAKLFYDGFMFYPMHTENTMLIDLSQLTILVIAAIVLVLLSVQGKISRKASVCMGLYILVTAIISYGAIFIAHVSIFAGETQYTSAEVMAISIARYAAPFTIGLIMMFIYLLCDRCVSGWIPVICAVFVLITTDYYAARDCLWGYRKTIMTDASARGDMIDDAGRRYIEATKDAEYLWNHRVLFLRDDNEIHWVKDTYISSEVAPVPTVYGGVDTVAMTSEDVAKIIRESHASYLYMQELDGDVTLLMQPFLPEGASYEPEQIYAIENADGNIRLIIQENAVNE